MPLFGKKKLEEVSILDAVARGLISFELYGAKEGDPSKVMLKIKKLTDEQFTLYIPKGTEFKPNKQEVKK